MSTPTILLQWHRGKKASSGPTLLLGHVGIVTALTLATTSTGKLTLKSDSKHRVLSALWKNSFHKGETKVAISLDLASRMIHKADALSSVSLYLPSPEFLYSPEFDPKHSHVENDYVENDRPRENDCQSWVWKQCARRRCSEDKLISLCEPAQLSTSAWGMRHYLKNSQEVSFLTLKGIIHRAWIKVLAGIGLCHFEWEACRVDFLFPSLVSIQSFYVQLTHLLWRKPKTLDTASFQEFSSSSPSFLGSWWVYFFQHHWTVSSHCITVPVISR